MATKVLFVPSWYPTDEAPVAGVFFEEQAQALADRFDIAVLVPEVIPFTLRAWLGHAKGSRREVRGGLLTFRHHAARPPWGPVRLAYPRLLRSFEWALDRVEREWGRPDILHAQVTLPAGWLTARAGVRRGIPVVLTEHCAATTLPLDDPECQKMAKEAVATARVLAVGPGVARELAALGEKDVETVGELVRTRFFSPAPEAERPSSGELRLFGVGGLRKVKGFDILISAIALLPRSLRESIRLVIGGDGEERAALAAQIASSGLDDRVRLVGWLSREETRSLMRWCDLFVTPSRAETFSVATAEAIACGKPVVATRSGGPEFVLTEAAGLLVPTENAAAIAEAVATIVRGSVQLDPILARKSVESRFGEDAFVDRLSRIYGSVLRERP